MSSCASSVSISISLLNDLAADCQFGKLRELFDMLAVRSFVVALSLAAWFALSNHCALGVALPPVETASETSACPMHSAPAKEKPATKTPCCKQLRAVVAKCV